LVHVAIIGNGITGVSAALAVRARQPDWKITILSGESRHHYSRPALMYVFMGHMRYRDTKPYEDWFWDEQRLDLVRAWVTGIDVERKTLALHGQGELTYDKLLIATGSKSNRFGWPGQDLDGVQGLYDLMDLRKLYANVEGCRTAVVVGGGLIGIELAEMLHSRGIHVTFLVRERSYWNNVLPAEESAMVNRLIREQGMDLRLETSLKEIVDDGSGRAGAVVTEETGERIECQLVGLTAGVSPNVELARASSIDVGRGVLVDDALRASAPDVWAAGDCAEIVRPEGERNLLQQVWYTGKAQGRVAGESIAGEDVRYDPGTWFNSAKFLDLEYQTYGRVGLDVEGEQSLYWEHEDGRHALRLVHVDGTLIGVNTMGLRHRHEVCERWIRDERAIEHVLDHLDEANFDPELFRRFEPEIRAAFRARPIGAEA